MKKIFIVNFFLLLSLLGYSQSYTVKGTVKDASGDSRLMNSSIVLINSKDSSLITFTRTDKNGEFELKNIAAGRYTLMITYPGYAEYVDVIEVNKDENIGQISMLTKAVALQNVIVRGGGAIRMKGDTLAFIADSFKVKDGASVEDLLKKLPGFQVNAKGEITAQGEKVEKVLVDGEEFFGDDPTIATQNLNANVVKEVQVFDKKSDQAAFTGIDDGQKIKTVNLKLKEDANKGYFGKVKMAGGLPNRWENIAMFNKFRQKKKFSAFGVMGNTGKVGLGWGEERQYGDGGGIQTFVDDENGGMSMTYNADEFGGLDNYWGEGLPKAWQGGFTYGNKWNEDKNNFNGSYRFQKQGITGGSSTNTQYILPDTQYYNNEKSNMATSKFRHKANASYEIAIDSSQSIKVSANGYRTENTTSNTYYNETLTPKGLFINQSDRSTSNNSITNNFNASALWKKKFKKKGRTLSINFSENNNDVNSSGFLLTYNKYYTGGQIIKQDTTDQKKINNTNLFNINSKIVFTEPINKKSLIEIDYGYTLVDNNSKKLSYNKLNEKYEQLDNNFSNDYNFNVQSHTAGISYRYNNKKLNFGLGSQIAQSNWIQDDLFKNITRKYNFTNFFPKANLSYKTSQYGRISFNYTGITKSPTLDQIQPIADNTNPLDIYIGNSDLKQSFHHTFNFSLNDYKVLSERSIWFNVNFNIIHNDFGTYDKIDNLGRKTYQTVNINGNYNSYANLYYYFKWKKPDIRLGFNISGNINKNNNYVNGLANTNNSQRISMGPAISKDVDKKYSISLNNNWSYNTSKSSIQSGTITKYWASHTELNGTAYLPWQIELSTDINYDWREKTTLFNNNNVLLWNASLEKKIFKKKDIKLGLKVNDILNQNLGFYRSINSNYISEKRYDIIKRFWLITFSWNFSKGPKKEEQW